MSKKSTVATNLFWRFLERTGAQIVTFIVSIVLARILDPKDYGDVAVITVLITIVNVFVDSGFANALIQKKDSDNDDFTTVFVFNIVLCIVLYVILWFFAPVFAHFYNNDMYVSLLRVLGITVIVSSLKNVQQAYVSKNLIFKRFFWATIIGTVISAAIGIIMALKGFGIWAIVAQHLSNTCIDTFVLWITVKWRPTGSINIHRLPPLLKYGYKLMLSSLIFMLYSNFRQLLIGKVYLTSELGFYNRGKQFPNIIMSNVNNSIDSVLFPVLSNNQNDNEKLNALLKKALSLSYFILAPLLVGLLSVARPLVELILTEKWLGCVPYIRVFCLLFLTWPLQTINLNVIKALGRSDLYLKLEVIESLYALILLIVALKWGPLWIAIMFMFSEMINCIVITRETKKIMNYGFFDQIKIIYKHLVVAGFMGVVVYGISYFFHAKYILFIQIPVGILLYVGAVYLMRFPEFDYALNFIKSKRMKNKKI